MVAINKVFGVPKGSIMYVTHTPCTNCRDALETLGIAYSVVENFMKFDSGKLRYSLIPPIAMQGIAEVLTYGAKKYKAKNYLNATEPDRFMDALYRHLEAHRRGELTDPESGYTHLAHALTNISILMDLDQNK